MMRACKLSGSGSGLFTHVWSGPTFDVVDLSAPESACRQLAVPFLTARGHLIFVPVDDIESATRMFAPPGNSLAGADGPDAVGCEHDGPKGTSRALVPSVELFEII